MVFTSNDNLHQRVVPLFLRKDQTFVKGQELKADLAKIDAHFATFPDDEKAKGLFDLASYPPASDAFLVTQLWDKHLPAWRKQREEHKKLDEEEQKEMVERINRVAKEAKSVSGGAQRSVYDNQYVHIERTIMRKKGKWVRVPPDSK